MKRFIESKDRHQVTLLPECLDDYVSEDNPVQVVDVFVEELDLQGLGFAGVDPAATGRPAYHPSVLLKLYIYGYLNRIQSSRRLERETQRNIELMWLTGRLTPDFKTIADFRRHNGPAIRNVCRQFIVMCRKLKLFSQAVVAIDGSKFKAVNSRDQNYSAGKIDGRQAQIEEGIQRYLDALDTADRRQPTEIAAKTERLQERIRQLREEMRQLAEIKEQLKTVHGGQISLTDPDARSMATSGKATGHMGYNVQAAVDAEHHLIVAHDVTNIGNDRGQLYRMACAARDAMEQPNLQALADRGYFNGPELKACEDEGIAVCVPKPMTSSAKAEGRYGKEDFIYLAQSDTYKCPANEPAVYRFTTTDKALKVRVYWSSACQSCPIKAQCTTGKERRIRRWEHEDVLERAQDRLERTRGAMVVRRRTVEHVFGTLKHWMGAVHFQMKTLAHVATEMSLHVLAYNLKRVINVFGLKATISAMREVAA